MIFVIFQRKTAHSLDKVLNFTFFRTHYSLRWQQRQRRHRFLPQTSLNLYTSDGEIIETTFELAKRSSTIKHLLEDLDIADDDERAVPLPAVNAPIMRIVLEWAELHKDDTEEFVAKANKDKRNSYNIPDADAEFLKKLDQGTFHSILEFAVNSMRSSSALLIWTDNRSDDSDCFFWLW